MLLALDRAPALVRTFDADGRMRVRSAPISKAGISEYFGEEIPEFGRFGLAPDLVYRLLRHPDELRRAAPSFCGLPLLSEHVPLTGKHRPELVIGALGSDASFKDPDLLCSVTVWARPAIDGIEDRSRAQVSCGYHYAPEMNPGVFRGRRFDGIMRKIVGHHAAVVDRGRLDCSL